MEQITAMLTQLMMMIVTGVGMDMNVSNREIITYHALIDLIANNSEIYNFNFCTHMNMHYEWCDDQTHGRVHVCVCCQLKQTLSEIISRYCQMESQSYIRQSIH